MLITFFINIYCDMRAIHISLFYKKPGKEATNIRTNVLCFQDHILVFQVSRPSPFLRPKNKHLLIC